MSKKDAGQKQADKWQAGLCAECKREISLRPAKVGQFLTCPHCDVELEVVGIDPLEFDWAYDWTWGEEDENDEAESAEERSSVISRAFCPDCDGEIRFNPHASAGQRLVCPHCAVDLEVLSVDPPVLDWAYAQASGQWGDVEADGGW